MKSVQDLYLLCPNLPLISALGTVTAFKIFLMENLGENFPTVRILSELMVRELICKILINS